MCHSIGFSLLPLDPITLVFTSGKNSTDVLVLAFGVAEALTLALVGEGCLLLAAIPSVLLFLVQLAAV
jgi:hypothetical protein